MAKTVAAGEIQIPHIGTFVANALPSRSTSATSTTAASGAVAAYARPADSAEPALRDGAGRQVLYRPRSLAAVINTVLSRPTGKDGRSRAAKAPHVSPYMPGATTSSPVRMTLGPRCAAYSRVGSTTA
jgi:hypothetical protein